MPNQLPTESDFIAYGDLDEAAAYDHFFGKSKEEAFQLLASDFLRYQEDFMFMGPGAFCYYSEAFTRYVTENFMHDDAVLFHTICDYRLDDSLAAQMKPCAIRIAETLDWLGRHAEFRDSPLGLSIHQTRDAYMTLAGINLA